MNKLKCDASMSRSMWLVLVASALVMWLNLTPAVVADGGGAVLPVGYEDSTGINSSGTEDSVTVVVEGGISISTAILLELWGLLF
jgi:hypothetical protein